MAQQPPTEPQARLDQPYSRPAATPTPWAEVEQTLSRAELSWITTVRADGRPHVTPLVAVWSDGRLHFCTGPDEQKAVNLRTNQQVAVTTGDNHRNDTLTVVVEGRAERITDETALLRLAEAWTRKWDGVWRFEVVDGAFAHDEGDGVALVFGITPDKVLSWSEPTGAATRHTVPRPS